MSSSLGSYRALSAAMLMAGAVAGIVGFAGQAAAYPEPEVVSDSWQLEFDYEHPKAIKVRLSDDQQPTLYWYVTYTALNDTGDERLFIPEAWMFTDTGKLLQANRRIPPEVFEAIENRESNPLLERPGQIVGRILQGEDNARDGMFVWRVPEEDIDNVRFFIAGLSGETHEVEDPRSGETRLLRKTLMVEYSTPGSAEYQDRKPFVFEQQRWVVR